MRHAHADADVFEHRRDDETPRLGRELRAVYGDTTGKRRKDPIGVGAADYRLDEGPRGDDGGGAVSARAIALVLDEEIRDQPCSERERDAWRAASGGDTQRGTLHELERVRPQGDTPRDGEDVAVAAPVLRDDGHRASSGEDDRRKRRIAESPGKGRYRREIRPVTAAQNDVARAAGPFRGGRELVEGPRETHVRAALDVGANSVDEGRVFPEPSRARVDDEEGAQSAYARSFPMRLGALSCWVALLTAACSMPPYVKTAYVGDLATLKREIHSAEAAHSLDRAKVIALAEAVARRELASARGDEALERIREARPCLDAVEPVLRDRANSADDAGGESLLALVEAGKVSRGSLVEKYGASPLGAFRAVAARVTGDRAHEKQRRSYYVDPDERVRRAAFRAAFDAKDPTDLDALLEAGRLDPDPRSRSLAVRAVGAVGGARASLGLTDLFPSADAAVRLSIVEAWGMPRVLALGGREELLRLAEARNSLASVAAAGQLSMDGGEGAAEGRAALVFLAGEGTTDERLVAIHFVKLPGEAAVAALDKAAKSDDASVRVAALGRLLEVPDRRAKALSDLEAIAGGHDGAARQAWAALVAVSDAKAIPLLRPGLQGNEASLREQAAVGLFELGRASEMASSLADSDPAVRMGVACGVLAVEDRSGSGV